MEPFNKELAKQLFEPMDAQELQDSVSAQVSRQVSAIWVKNFNGIGNKISLYSVQIQENTDQKKIRIWTPFMQ